MNFDSDMLHQMWTFTGGVIIVIVQSLLTGAKRNWRKLLLGCVLGGVGSWIAGQIWGDSKFIFLICGVAAICAENVIVGVFNASKQFADNPIKVATHMARTVMPKWTGVDTSTSTSVNTDDLK